MKTCLYALQLVVSLLCLLATTSCTNVFTFNDAAGERDAFVDAHATWKSGISTFDEMKAAYGEPDDRVPQPAGFAVRWLRTRRIASSAAPRFAATNPVARFESDMERPQVYLTVKTTLEAFYNEQGILSSFRIQTER